VVDDSRATVSPSPPAEGTTRRPSGPRATTGSRPGDVLAADQGCPRTRPRPGRRTLRWSPTVHPDPGAPP
jgi:hypothetical protein